MPAYWLVKQEPTSYPFSQLVADGCTAWTGVRNNAARANLLAMKTGDQVLYYHSQVDKAVVGIAHVVEESYPDPTAGDPRWLAVDIAPIKPLVAAVTLAQVKADEQLAEMALVRNTRLSVQPVTAAEFKRVLKLGETRL